MPNRIQKMRNNTIHIYPKVHDTKLEINLSAIQHNLEYYKSQLPPRTKVMAMVKANAYGLGDQSIAKYLEKIGIDYLGVAYLNEGIELRNHGIKTPILIMNPSENIFQQARKFQLDINISNFDLLDQLIEFANHNYSNHPPLSIHLKIDTGMRRLGFMPENLLDLIERLHQTKNICIQGIFSHLASPEDRSFTLDQIKKFNETSQIIENKLHKKLFKHILNSPSVSEFGEYANDMVRLGIGLYGIGGTKTDQTKLMNVACMKTTISQVKTVQKGDTIGYGRVGKITKAHQKIAVLAIGYADGYDRRFSDGIGKVLIHGKYAPVIGNVCMDMTMVDVTGLDVKRGDEVILFNDKLTVSELAEQIGTIPYEIFTKIGQRVKRVCYTSYAN